MNSFVNCVLSMFLMRYFFLCTDAILLASCLVPFRFIIVTPFDFPRFVARFVHICTVYIALWSYTSHRWISYVVQTTWHKVYSAIQETLNNQKKEKKTATYGLRSIAYLGAKLWNDNVCNISDVRKLSTLQTYINDFFVIRIFLSTKSYQ